MASWHSEPLPYAICIKSDICQVGSDPKKQKKNLAQIIYTCHSFASQRKLTCVCQINAKVGTSVFVGRSLEEFFFLDRNRMWIVEERHIKEGKRNWIFGPWSGPAVNKCITLKGKVRRTWHLIGQISFLFHQPGFFLKDSSTTSAILSLSKL